MGAHNDKTLNQCALSLSVSLSLSLSLSPAVFLTRSHKMLLCQVLATFGS